MSHVLELTFFKRSFKRLFGSIFAACLNRCTVENFQLYLNAIRTSFVVVYLLSRFRISVSAMRKVKSDI